MDKIHTDMGIIFIVLHTNGVCILQGLPENLFILDIAGQIAFLVDIILQFFLAYRDSQTYRLVYKRTPIALR